ncbi:response regulator [Pedobacter yonginense]|uniref:Response regulator n=1 Tax=Pedobacter yonginense TaxID=651869 RepID=A0A317ENW3_9SPHI|nr:response regulator [Pedobacter yonginense]PWS28501.1 response regulator [Pedobacter yonginense]
MGKRICVLEDNEDIREIISFVLEDEKYEVFTFATIKDFEKGARALHPHAFLLDVMLPDGNGLDVCCNLKAESETRNVPVLMMSANYSANQMSKQCTAEDFIHKPFDIYDFVKRIDAQIQRN